MSFIRKSNVPQIKQVIFLFQLCTIFLLCIYLVSLFKSLVVQKLWHSYPYVIVDFLKRIW